MAGSRTRTHTGSPDRGVPYGHPGFQETSSESELHPDAESESHAPLEGREEATCAFRPFTPPPVCGRPLGFQEAQSPHFQRRAPNRNTLESIATSMRRKTRERTARFRAEGKSGNNCHITI